MRVWRRNAKRAAAVSARCAALPIGHRCAGPVAQDTEAYLHTAGDASSVAATADSPRDAAAHLAAMANDDPEECGVFYEPGVTDHGLPYDPFKSCVVPRPIGWVSTRSRGGTDNLAPFSQFTNVSFDPPMVMFSSNQTTAGTRKDSVVNAEETGVFVWNMATWDLREAVNLSAEELPHGVDEFDRAGLAKCEARQVAVSCVADSPVAFECRYLQTLRLPGNGPMGTVDVVFGRVVGVHIADHALTPDGRVDVIGLRPIARLGYFDYTSVESRFEMVVPGDRRLLVGLEGAAARNR